MVAMRIVVIGATGHVGGCLIPRLDQSGHDVIAISRADNELRRPLGTQSSTLDGGWTWKRTGPLATPVRRARRSPRATTSSTTKHTMRRPGRWVELARHIVSIRQR
jgi:hypothetical protein